MGETSTLLARAQMDVWVVTLYWECLIMNLSYWSCSTEFSNCPRFSNCPII